MERGSEGVQEEGKEVCEGQSREWVGLSEDGDECGNGRLVANGMGSTVRRTLAVRHAG